MDQRSSVDQLLGGISLSPAFVVMFAMQYYQISWEDALHLVQNRRYCISPNGGFLTQIKVRPLVHLTSFEPTSYRNTKQYTKRISLLQHIRSLSVRFRGGREMTRMTKRIPIGIVAAIIPGGDAKNCNYSERMIAKESWLQASRNLSMIPTRWRHSTHLFITHFSLLSSWIHACMPAVVCNLYILSQYVCP
jgi:hypothetical protein